MVQSLSAFGLQPIAGGPLTQPVPGSSAAAATTVAPAIQGFSRRRLDTVQIGDILLPPSQTDGRAVLTFTKKIKADQKSGAGKTAPKTTITAVDPAEGTLVLTWKKRANKAMEANLALLQPGAGPFTIAHANASLYGVSSVLIAEWGEGVVWDDFQVAKLTIKLTEVPLGAGVGVLLLFKGCTDASISTETGGLGPTEVTRWQTFMVQQGFGAILGVPPVNGTYGDTTAAATLAFQTRETEVKLDGIVGPETFGKAAQYGYAAPPAVKALGAGGTKTAAAAADTVTPGSGWGDGGQAARTASLQQQRDKELRQVAIANGLNEAGDP